MAATITPSKAAASALADISLTTPKKAGAEQTDLLSKLKAAAAVEAGVVDKVDVVVAKPEKLSEAELRQRFVGDIHCEEKDEPILKESADRFVLFPIRYNEVSRVECRVSRVTRPRRVSLTGSDLANVQEGPGILLDCRGDQPRT